MPLPSALVAHPLPTFDSSRPSPRRSRWTAALWLAAVGVPLLWSASGCQNAPLNGRGHFVAVPQEAERQLTEDAWRELLVREKLSANAEHRETLEQVGRKLASVSDHAADPWEFRLLATDRPAAFCLPGGKLAVSEGLLATCESEADLAVVLSREMGHAFARHGKERMARLSSLGIGGRLSQDADDRQMRWQQAHGMPTRPGTTFAYSRQHNAEADSIGLMLMAKAGYDPAEAPKFWQRMAAASVGKSNDYLAAHPFDSQRSTELQQILPQAQAIYQAAPQRIGRGRTLSGPSAGEKLAANFPTVDSIAGPAASSVPASNHLGDNSPAAMPSTPAVSSDGFIPPLQRPRALAANPAAEANSSDNVARPFPTAP